MASSLITALTVTTPLATTAPTPGTDGEQCGLLNALAKVPDPHDPREIRHPLSAVLAVAVCAVMAGASSFAVISDWLHDLDERARTRLGSSSGVPAGTTRWRLLSVSIRHCRPPSSPAGFTPRLLSRARRHAATAK
ncbi:transposase family protein [Actinoplanes philippinensis]|uniref:transposase family protein n=1 Tax=Actinoplanes philippinensis TaxID=35752 RepID=UPI001EF1879C|nr:transposase family protein [Actinoplanes philippinensis]